MLDMADVWMQVRACTHEIYRSNMWSQNGAKRNKNLPHQSNPEPLLYVLYGQP